MNYFGVNRKIPVESKYWEGPKERLKQNEVVIHLIEVNIHELRHVTNFNFIYEKYSDRFEVSVHRDFYTIKVYLRGKRKDLLKEFSKLNEVSK